jgi:T-complex protein 1 subunit eta
VIHTNFSSQVGDGTTTVVLLAGEFLREAKPFIEDGVHPQLIIRAFRIAANLVVKKVKDLAVSIEGKSMTEKKSLLEKCAATTLSSKLVGGEKEFFAKMVVDAVTSLGADNRLNMIGIKKVTATIENNNQEVLKFCYYFSSRAESGE